MGHVAHPLNTIPAPSAMKPKPAAMFQLIASFR
jgi:hypothetical protein